MERKGKKFRRLRIILYNNRHKIESSRFNLDISCKNSYDLKTLINLCIQSYDKNLANEFIELANELNASDSDLINLLGYDMREPKSYHKFWMKEFHNKFSKQVYVTRRDNKSYVNKGSGAQGSYIRYPSKKRSLRTWRNFYNLFPWLAVRDKWNGKTSKRYNNENNKGRKSK